MGKIIFVVDNDGVNLTAVKETLTQHYQVMCLSSAEETFVLLEKVSPNLILLDIGIHEMGGVEALYRLKNNPAYAHIPVILFVGYPDVSMEARFLQLGAADFILKPFSPPILINRIKNHISLDAIVREQTSRLQRLQNGIVSVLADLLERRDIRTWGHVERTTLYIRILFEGMLKQGLYLDEISSIDVDLFVASARLHDVGKISISDVILNKPGKLTEEEFATMMTHTIEGERVIDQIVTRTGADETFLRYAKFFAGYHHEHWNGNGYPYKLQGTNIPIYGRIMAIVDVYDAIISARSYKESLTHEEAVEIIVNRAGKQFDPYITKAFYNISEQLKTISDKDLYY